MLVGAPRARDPEAVYLLTGTPMTSRPRDLFNLLKAVRHPLATQLLQLRQALLRGRRQRLRPRHERRLEPRGAREDRLRRHAAAHEDEALDLPPKMRTWQPVDVDGEAVRQLEARALDFYERNPARGGPTWVTFLGLLNTGAPRARGGQGAAHARGGPRAGRRRREGRRLHVVTPAVVEKMQARVRRALRVRSPEPTRRRARQQAADRFQTDDRVRVLRRQPPRRRGRHHPHRRDPRRLQRSRLGARQPLAGRGPHLPDRPDAAGVRHLPVAEGTLDDFVAALLEQKARTIGVLEDEAADRATLLDASRRASPPRRDPACAGPAAGARPGSVGLLGDVLDLFIQASRGLGELEPSERILEIPSNTDPATVYRVKVVQGVISCESKGFGYRGTCSHARSTIHQLENAA